MEGLYHAPIARSGTNLRPIGKFSAARFAVRLVASLAFDVRRRHDWRPAGNFALNEYREWLLTSCGLGRYIGAEVEQTLTHARVIQCLVDGIAERVTNRLRRALGGKQRKPRCRLKFRQPCLFRGRDIRNGRVTFGSP